MDALFVHMHKFTFSLALLFILLKMQISVF